MDGRGGIFGYRNGPLPPEIIAELQFLEGGLHDRNHVVRNQRLRPRRRDVPHWHLNEHFDENHVIWELDQCVLPPISVSIHAQIVQDTSQVTATQLFWNDTDHSIPEATYSLPLPTGCTVTEFICRIGQEKIVRAKIKPKQEARDAYDRAVRNDRTAALLEQTAPDVFTTTLGNIPKHTKIRVQVSFISLLDYEFVNSRGRTTFTIPASLGSNCGNPRPRPQAALPTGIQQRVSIDIEISAAEQVQKIRSASHGVVVERRQGTINVDNWNDFAAPMGEHEVQVANVRLEDGSVFLDKDFTLDISTAPLEDEESPQAWLEVLPNSESDGAIMLTIPPKFCVRNTQADEAGEIVFVADRSYSMTTKIHSLKSAIRYFLRSIPQGRNFNIWSFGTNYSYLWPRSKSNTDQGPLQQALRHVDAEFAADMGGTELLPALKAIRGSRDENRTIDIVVLTDGHVFHMEDTIEYVRQMKRVSGDKVRVFALGIGRGVSHELVEGLARAGGGYAEVISDASEGGWESRVVAVLEAAIHGHVSPIHIQLEGTSLTTDEALHVPQQNQRPQILKSPSDLSTLSPFLRQRLFMLLNDGCDLSALSRISMVSTSENDQEVVTHVPLKRVPERAEFIHKLGARAILGDLENGRSWVHTGSSHSSRTPTETEDIVRSEGEHLGCKWSLVSKWTSFFAVDEPCQPDAREQDPFMDAANDGMDLLRPRGLVHQEWAYANLDLQEHVREIHVDSDEDDDSASTSQDDPEVSDGGSSDGSDDDDDQPGGGAGNSQGGNNAGDNDDIDDSDPSGNNHADDYEQNNHATGAGNGDAETTNHGVASYRTAEEAVSGSLVDDTMTFNAAAPQHTEESLGRKLQTPPSGEEAWLNSSLASDPPSRLQRRPLHSDSAELIGHGGSGPIVSSDHAISYGARSTPRPWDLNTADLSQSSDDTGWKSARSRRFDDMAKSSHDSAQGFKRKKYTTLERRSFGSTRFPSVPSIGSQDSSTARAPQSSITRKPFHPGDPPLKPRVSTTSSVPTLSAFQAPRSDFDLPIGSWTEPPFLPPDPPAEWDAVMTGFDFEAVDVATSDSVPPHFDFPSFDAMDSSFSPSSQTAQETSSTPMFPALGTLQEATSLATGPLSAISAPQHNISAASSLLQQQRVTAMTPEQQEGDQIIQKLVKYQYYDGSFRFSSDTILSSILGRSFLLIVQNIQSKLDGFPRTYRHVPTTIAIMVFFEEKLPYCKDLWTLICAKAQNWVDQNLKDISGQQKSAIFDTTRAQMASYEFHLHQSATSANTTPNPSIQPWDPALPNIPVSRVEQQPPTCASLSLPAIYVEPFSSLQEPNEEVHFSFPQPSTQSQPQKPYLGVFDEPSFAEFPSYSSVLESVSSWPETSAAAPAPTTEPFNLLSTSPASPSPIKAATLERYGVPGQPTFRRNDEGFGGRPESNVGGPFRSNTEAWDMFSYGSRENITGDRIPLDSVPGEDDA